MVSIHTIEQGLLYGYQTVGPIRALEQCLSVLLCVKYNRKMKTKGIVQEEGQVLYETLEPNQRKKSTFIAQGPCYHINES